MIGGLLTPTSPPSSAASVPAVPPPSTSTTREFYENEDLPTGYQRREFPYYSVEANNYIDRMTEHIGFQIVRPFPEGDGMGIWRDVEPVVAKFDYD